MGWTVVKKGKHIGKTLPQIIFSDPDYFFWGIENDVFNGALASEAKELNYKARNIRIPQGMKAEYIIHRPTRKFDHMELVPENRPPHQGSSPTFREDVIDLSVPRRFADYDKLGCKNLLLSLKIRLLGNRHIRLTKRRCEEFFEDDENFVISDEFRQEMGSIFR